MKKEIQKILIISALLFVFPLFVQAQNSELDLKVGNYCFYNERLCMENGSGDFVWEGTDEPCSCTWSLSGLENKLFFDFQDLKPGDSGGDVISLVVNKDSWSCLTIALTESAENGINDPESEVDDTEGKWGGELDEEMEFFFWVDDGDANWEPGEKVLFEGKPSDLPQEDGNEGRTYRLADSTGSLFADDWFKEGETYQIGKVWCFGDLFVEDGVLRCDGSLVGNTSQTDSIKGDIEFYVQEIEEGEDFYCKDEVNGEPTDNGGEGGGGGGRVLGDDEEDEPFFKSVKGEVDKKKEDLEELVKALNKKFQEVKGKTVKVPDESLGAEGKTINIFLRLMINNSLFQAFLITILALGITFLLEKFLAKKTGR